MSGRGVQPRAWKIGLFSLFVARRVLPALLPVRAEACPRVRAHRGTRLVDPGGSCASETLLVLAGGSALCAAGPAGAVYQGVLRDAWATTVNNARHPPPSASLGGQSLPSGSLANRSPFCPRSGDGAGPGSPSCSRLCGALALQQRRCRRLLLCPAWRPNSVCAALIIVIYGLVSANKSSRSRVWPSAASTRLTLPRSAAFAVVVAVGRPIASSRRSHGT